MSSEEVKLTESEEKKVEEIKEDEVKDNTPSTVITVEPAPKPVEDSEEENKEPEEDLDKEALIAEAKALGITGNLASWKTETIIKKINEVKDKEEKKPKIDPRVQAMLDLNKNRKRKEADKQRDIYAAMASIKIVRS